MCINVKSNFERGVNICGEDILKGLKAKVELWKNHKNRLINSLRTVSENVLYDQIIYRIYTIINII